MKIGTLGDGDIRVFSGGVIRIRPERRGKGQYDIPYINASLI